MTAHEDYFEFNSHNSSASLNGMDQDKRRQQEEYDRKMHPIDEEEDQERY